MAESMHIADSAAIDAEYRRLGHPLGWRFLTCPKGNIANARVALVSTNPGGDIYVPPIYSVENGSAYAIESWKGRPPGQENLQVQVLSMFSQLGLKPEDVLSGYLVPFRSPSWDRLGNKALSLAVGISLWAQVFRYAAPELVIALGKQDAGPSVAELLRARLKHRELADWDSQTIDTYIFNDNRRLVVLPHLSRYKLFSRPTSRAAFVRAVGIG